MEQDEVYSVIGEEGFRHLVAAFYRQVPRDEILGSMYPAQDLEAAERRLGDFLIYRFGGPPRYIEERGHPRLRMRHARFEIGHAARDRWLALMHAALEQAKLPREAEQMLRDFFESTATFLINQPQDAAREA